jgi:hypothetical protein
MADIGLPITQQEISEISWKILTPILAKQITSSGM